MGVSKFQTANPLAGLADEVLAQFSDFIAAHMGLHFPRKQWRTLERGMVCAAREFGFDDPESCIRWIMSSSLPREQIERVPRRHDGRVRPLGEFAQRSRGPCDPHPMPSEDSPGPAGRRQKG